MASNRPIGFFDSGIGLLSILKETKKVLPKESFVIFADQKNNPFGEKSEQELQKFSESAILHLINNHNIKLMTVACNTASVAVLNHLRKKFDIPIIGVVPAIKPAAITSKNGRIAIFATVLTAKSTYLKNLIKNHALGKKVLIIPCKKLAESIEIQDIEKIEKLLKNYLKLVEKFNADTLVLGSTHYPLVKTKIRKISGSRFRIVDSGTAVAARLHQIVLSKNIQSETRAKDYFYTTGNPQLFSKIASTILKYNVEAKSV
ncbi:MAG: glutamate racemase [Candidatus Curtissbacteria bacterium]|nr:glutamate racemase [Candidatus Curtissbacteria bacterium]